MLKNHSNILTRSSEKFCMTCKIYFLFEISSKILEKCYKNFRNVRILVSAYNVEKLGSQRNVFFFNKIGLNKNELTFSAFYTGESVYIYPVQWGARFLNNLSYLSKNVGKKLSRFLQYLCKMLVNSYKILTKYL
jgi:hypothetical protein